MELYDVEVKISLGKLARLCALENRHGELYNELPSHQGDVERILVERQELLDEVIDENSERFFNTEFAVVVDSQVESVDCYRIFTEFDDMCAKEADSVPLPDAEEEEKE